MRELEVRSRNAAREARDLGDVEPDSIARVLDVGSLVRGTLNQDVPPHSRFDVVPDTDCEPSSSTLPAVAVR